MNLEPLLGFWDPYVEHCGILTADGEVFLIDNIAEHHGGEFAMAQEDVMAVCPLDRVVGVWHTHPSNTNWMSDTDLEGLRYAIASGGALATLRYFIVTQSEITEWELDEHGTPREVART